MGVPEGGTSERSFPRSTEVVVGGVHSTPMQRITASKTVCMGVGGKRGTVGGAGQ